VCVWVCLSDAAGASCTVPQFGAEAHIRLVRVMCLVYGLVRVCACLSDGVRATYLYLGFKLVQIMSFAA